MNILIVTQRLDTQDPILGFFHRWVEEFATKFDRVIVIGQYVGTHHLPDNVQVHSLGKEEGTSSLMQVFRFWKLISSLRSQYDVVFVHMIALWVVLGSLLWKLIRKPIYLWYESRGARWPLRASFLLVHKVFSASERGMPLATAKSVIMGHGIDTEFFKPDLAQKETGHFVTVSRIATAKRLDLIVQTIADCDDCKHCTIVGVPITEADFAYAQKLQQQLYELNLHDTVVIAPMLQRDVAHLLQRADLFLHASTTPLDKALLEAMSCGCLVVSCGDAARQVLPDRCVATTETFGEVINSVIHLQDEERIALSADLRQRILAKHGLRSLVERLQNEMNEKD